MSENKVTVRRDKGRETKNTVYPYVWSRHYYTHGDREGQRCRVWARGTMESTSRYSSGVWALPPTGPVAHRVGAPALAAKPESAQPPVNSAGIFAPSASAQPA